MKRNSNASALRLFAAVPILAAVLAGCTVMSSAPDSATPERIENAEPHTAEVSTAIESLQRQVWEGAWAPAAGGNQLVPCEPHSLSGNDSAQDESAYRFYGSWFTTDGYEAPVDLAATAQELSSWLSATGWSDVEIESSASPIYWRVWATREGTGAVETMVTWYPEGDVDTAQPHVVLDVDSACSPADTQV